MTITNTSQLELNGKTALVTGASGGLGEHFASILAAAGAKVILAGRRAEPLAKLAKRISSEGGEALTVSLDVTSSTGVSETFDLIQSEGWLADIVVCNAGVATGSKSLDTREEDWDKVLDTNLKGCWLVANEAAKRLIAAERPGSIINITSILSHRVASNVVPYTTSKAALEQLTRALALEWARHNIRVNALAPGYIETDLNRDFFATEPGKAMIKRIPQRRLGQPGDLTGPLLLLASDLSAYMTGSTLVADGGHLQSTL
ncbi:MAG: SDR family oxidoreductase [Marinobacter sp.]|uniref:SDR family NAD(P)-dependent oxidoreductase n=1 Tax=Marinobacter sp. TaxID=50741 RepID=UPI0034A09C42